MGQNIKKFTSTAEYDAFRSTDGWAYPNVSFIETNIENQVRYNNEFIMRWSDNANNKVPTFLGDVSHEDFVAWVDNASMPCEIKKDGTGFNYLKPDDFTKTINIVNGTETGTSHYQTEDKNDYLQMTEIANINVGLFQDSSKGTKEVRFNFDKGCPKGFHKWFAHPFWNENRGVYTKLIARYDSAPAGENTSATSAGINVAYGDSQGAWTSDNYAKGNWSSNLLHAANKATGANILEETYWEHVVLTYIFSAYFKTFDHQSIYGGLQSDYNSGNAGQWKAGQTDSLNSHKGQLGNNMGYRFMHIENAIHGKQWIWCAGWVGNVTATTGTYWMTYDDIIANKAATMAKDDADVYGPFLGGSGVENKFIGKIDLWGNPIEAGGSSSSGFYDAVWAYNIYDSRVAYVGGISDHGLSVGGFARSFDGDASISHWRRRGRITMNR